MRVFVTGCAKSGTTLLRRLFHAFSGVRVVPHEIGLSDFLALSDAEGPLVGKRLYNTVFSWPLTPAEAKAQIDAAERAGVRLVNIYRDGRDVVESGIPATRWCASIAQMLTHVARLRYNVRYEELVTDPDGVQQAIAAALGLTPEQPFSNYPQFFPGDGAEQIYIPRPISTDRIGKNLSAYGTHAGASDEFMAHLRTLGYV